MIIDISVAVFALAFVVLVIFAIRTLISTRKTMKKVDRVLSDVHRTLENEGTELLENVNDLTANINEKLDALDIIFHPLQLFKKKEKKQTGEFAEVIECVNDVIDLYHRIKEKIKDYV